MKRLQKYKISSGMLHIFFICFSLIFIIPVVTIVSISFSDEMHVLKNGYSILPQALSLDAYKLIFEKPDAILNAYEVSIALTFIGTLLGLALSSACAYSISRNDFRYRKQIIFFLFFTLLFNGGLVPSYILYTRYLHLKDSLAGLILPVMINVFFILILRTFFQSLPFSIIESSIIDGAGEFTIFLRMIVPLSKPALATVGLMIMLNYWNEWFIALLLVRKSSLRPLQYLLQLMLLEADAIINEINQGNGAILMDPSKIPTQTARMAMVVVAAGPMLFVFPFFQKYFTKGLTLGSIKG